MKILYINHLPLVGSGSGVYTTNLAKSMKKNGHEVGCEKKLGCSLCTDMKLFWIQIYKAKNKSTEKCEVTFGL